MSGPPPGPADALAGRYRLESEIGRGAGATVYRALDLRHGRAVALKLLHPDLGVALGPARFQREIRTLARLQHPHILPLFDSGDADGRLYYTMPLVPDGSLRERLERSGPLPVADVLRLGTQLASALTAAHAQGVIHRDIKPANILLTGSGDALLADFGIAAAIEAGATGRLTESGIALGSPAYMSPEQAAGDEPVDARSDVYALATVLYQGLAGRPPFAGPNARAVMAARLTESPPPLSSLRPDLSAPVAAAIMRGLARGPDDRFESAAAFAAALLQASAPAAPPPARRWGRPAIALACAGLVVLGIVLARGIRRPIPQAPPAGRVLAVLPFRNLGRAEDRYFADGLTEELTGRLASLVDLRVISRTSADQYAGSLKSLPAIGKELGADYLLEGSVEWEHPDSGAGRIRIRPRLVRASDDAQLWSLSFEAEPAGVLALQASVADRVREALGLALAAGGGAFDVGETADPQAYDLYLRGNDYAGRGNTEGALRSAIQLYQEAVARDSGFARAWARLARVSLQIYWYNYDHTEARLASARTAAEIAARLAPDLPETRLALGFYHYWGRQDYPAAQGEFASALRRQPSNPDLLQALAYVERRRGDWTSSLEHFEAARRLDPRSGVRHFEVGDNALALQRFDEAERAFDEAILLSPDWADPYVYQGWLAICREGDFARARALLRRVLARIEPERVVVALSSGDLPSASPATADSTFWPLLDRVSASTFPGDQARYHIIKAELEGYRGRPAARRAHGDSALRIARAQAALAPDDPRVLNRLALAQAYAGRTDEAVRIGRRVLALMPVTRDGVSGYYSALALARIYADAGRAADAVTILRELRPYPGLLSAAALRSDPAWTGIRSDPRFQALLAERLPFGTMSTPGTVPRSVTAR